MATLALLAFFFFCERLEICTRLTYKEMEFSLSLSLSLAVLKTLDTTFETGSDVSNIPAVPLSSLACQF